MKNLDWQYQTHLRARYLFEQMEEMLKSAPSEAEKLKFLQSSDNFYLQKLNEIYRDEFQLAILMDKSDVMFHARGDGATHESPELNAVNWLTKIAQSSFRKISNSYLSKHFSDKELAKVTKGIGFKFQGYAPGSIYLGFSVESESRTDTLFGDESSPIHAIKKLIMSLSDIPQFIINNKVDKKAILEIIDDPAMRDTALQVSYEISPNGNMGIDELSVANSERHKGTYTQITKRLFKEAIKQPLSGEKQTSSFYGEIREIDLDKVRFELRGVKGIGTIRCIKPKGFSAREIIGEYCKVTGEYETDKNGKPSLMQVTDIKIETPQQNNLDY